MAPQSVAKSLSRFCRLLQAGPEEDAYWHRGDLGYAHSCLEVDYFKGGNFANLVLRLGQNSEEGKLGFTNKRVDTDDKHNLYRACSNQMVVGTLVFADPENQLRERAILAALGPTHELHKAQNHKLRSLGASPACMLYHVTCLEAVMCVCVGGGVSVALVGPSILGTIACVISAGHVGLRGLTLPSF